jgi:ribonuclease VapC
VIVDSSALVAVALSEPPAHELGEKLRLAETRAIGTPTLVETGIVLAAKLADDARLFLSEILIESDIEAVALGPHHWRTAFDAALRYGEGRHPARLNFGDCLTYAVAKLSGQPLLCTRDDFARTDLVLA